MYPASAQQKDVTTRVRDGAPFHIGEQRPYMCAEYTVATACVTHLTVMMAEYDGADQGKVRTEAGRAQRAQCGLLKDRLAAAGSAGPTLFGGDLNLHYDPGAALDAQDCVPGGHVRKGDGDVQHLVASPQFDFHEVSVSKGDLVGTTIRRSSAC